MRLEFGKEAHVVQVEELAMLNLGRAIWNLLTEHGQVAIIHWGGGEVQVSTHDGQASILTINMLAFSHSGIGSDDLDSGSIPA